jgi:histidinol phosphatase-like PHP family hydrolase
MHRVNKALKDGNVAMEINDRLHLPGPEFIKRAKDAGVRFTFGSGNTGAADLGKLSYCIAMIEECRLTPKNLWEPKLR